MHLLISTIVGLLNALVALMGASGTWRHLSQRPGIETVTSFLIATVPFAAVALFAFGRRTKTVWLVAIALNSISVVGTLAMMLIARDSAPSASAGQFVVGLTIAGVFATFNVAYLLWRAPRPAVASAEREST